MSTPTGERIWQVLGVVTCLAAGVLLGVTHRAAHGADVTARAVDLATLIRESETRIANAEQSAAELVGHITDVQKSDLNPQVEAMYKAGDGYLAPAGLTDVTGPGLRVSLIDAARDADGKYPAGVNPDDLVVHQQDVQAVVNALWAGGAEAMSIMGQRVIATSAVRCIGNTLLLHGRSYSPPFVIEAIGNSAAMEDALNVQPGVILYRKYVDRFGLGFTVQPQAELKIPGYQGVLVLNAASGTQR